MSGRKRVKYQNLYQQLLRLPEVDTEPVTIDIATFTTAVGLKMDKKVVRDMVALSNLT